MALAEAWKSGAGRQVREVLLASNMIGTPGAQAIASAVSAMPALQECPSLLLASSHCFSLYLTASRSISLLLDRCHCVSLFLTACVLLSKDLTLGNWMGGNLITDDGAHALIDAICTAMPNIIELKLNLNPISKAAFEEMHATLKNRQVLMFDL